VKVSKRKTSPVTMSVLVGLAAALVLGAGVFLLVLPQRSKASDLDQEVATVHVEIAKKRAESLRKPEAPIRVAELFKLVKAMPDYADEPGILLQLNQTARDAGIAFDKITPQPPVASTDSVTFPIDVEFSGSFYDLNDFVYRLRSLVAVRRGRLEASGRLFSIDSIEFGEGPTQFPNLIARLRVNAYVYGTNVPGVVPVTPPPAPTTETTESTTTEKTESEPPSSGEATAVGSR
jgi:Pilus assembly protein, PilO